MAQSRKKKILLVVFRYPQITQTYIEAERRELARRYEVKVVAFSGANTPFADHGDFTIVPRDDSARFREVVEAFGPDMIHAHWLFVADKAFEASRIAGVPFTVRAHSFDVLAKDQTLEKSSALINSKHCAGILSFPFTLPILEHKGFNLDKVHACHPVLDFERFHDRSPNAGGVMNVGAWKPKKNMDWFFELARRFGGRNVSFDLYAPGINAASVVSEYGLQDVPIQIRDPAEPGDMPAEYKKHTWLVYTASPVYNTVGWPVVVAEAQASGVGVCMQNIRPDLKEYVGEAGYVFDSLDEVSRIISQPFPEHLRQLGFEQAKLSDIRTHIWKLERLWGFQIPAREEVRRDQITISSGQFISASPATARGRMGKKASQEANPVSPPHQASREAGRSSRRPS
jgi:glycosyltransferase involved in cell wall biosynthesis